jgi:hypothetical protein
MTKSKTTAEEVSIQPDPTPSNILPTNYPALEYVNWFIADTQNTQNLIKVIFNGGINTGEKRLVDLLAAANKSIQETEDDVAKIKEYLAKIIPTA